MCCLFVFVACCVCLFLDWLACNESISHILDGVWSYPGWRKSSKRSQIKDGKDDDGSDGSNALVSRETAISVSGVHRGLYRGPGLPPWRHRLVNQPSQPSQTHPCYLCKFNHLLRPCTISRGARRAVTSEYKMRPSYTHGLIALFVKACVELFQIIFFSSVHFGFFQLPGSVSYWLPFWCHSRLV